MRTTAIFQVKGAGSPAAVLLALSVTVAAQGDPWYGRAPKTPFQALRGPDAEFAMEYPRKDWIALSGVGSVLVILAHNKAEASIVVERTALHQPLAAEDITDLFAELEMDAIRKSEPRAATFQSRTITAAGRRLVAVQFTRPGVRAGETVRQYSIPVQTHLYRLVCSAATAVFPKYESIFAHVAASFSVVGTE